MSIVLTTIAIATAVWLFLKLILVEFPSFSAIVGMRKLGGPKGLPLFIGETWNIMKMEKDGLVDYLMGLSASHPRLTAFYMAGIPMVYVQTPKDIKHVLESTKNIKKGSEYQLFAPWLNDGLLTSFGNKWHTRRKMLTSTFHFKILEDAVSGMSKSTDILADKLYKTEGKIVNVEEYVGKCTLDIIAETAMGVQLDSQTNEGSQYLKCVNMISGIMLHRILSIYLVKDILFTLSPSGSMFRKCLKVVHEFTNKVIAKRKENSDLKPKEQVLGSKTRKAFLDSLIAMQKNNPQSFTDNDIREEVDTFMFEGHDTTSAGIFFGLWLIGSHPEIQEKIYQEIIETVGNNEITRSDLNQMSYLDRVIKEILRLYPSVPMFTRRLVEDIILDDGVVLSAGLNVLIMPYLLHRDPTSFSDPEKFDPDRFLEDVSTGLGRNPYAYIPFSAGPRNCIGQKFAQLEMKLTLASVIRKCRIISITKREEFKIIPQLIIRPSIPLKCKFIQRDS